MRRRRFLLGCLAFSAAQALWGHDPGLSTGRVEIQNGTIVIEVTFSSVDLAALHPPGLPPGANWIRGLFQLEDEGKKLSAGSASVEPAPTAGEFQFRLIFTGVRSSSRRTITALRLAELPPGHRQYIAVTDAQGRQLLEKLLSAADAVIEIPAGPNASRPARAAAIAP